MDSPLLQAERERVAAEKVQLDSQARENKASRKIRMVEMAKDILMENRRLATANTAKDITAEAVMELADTLAKGVESSTS